MSDANKTETGGPSRRTVVRTAAHAAWAVPAIQIVTSAPAFAAISQNDIQDGTATITGNGAAKTGTLLTVSNDGPNVLAAGTVQLILTAPTGNTWLLDPLPSITGNWVYSGGAGSTTVTFTYNGTVAVGTNVSLTGTVKATLAVNAASSAVGYSFIYTGTA